MLKNVRGVPRTLRRPHAQHGRGNPVSNNDPTGHCATNEDGSPNTKGDFGCWEAAREWHATYGTGGLNEADWTKYFASAPGTTEDILRAGLYHYWHPLYEQWGVYHPIYNPPPVMNPVPEQPLISLPGNYGAVNVSTSAPLGGALIVDDYGNVYLRVDIIPFSTPSISLVRGKINLYQGGLRWTDMENLGLSIQQQRELAPNVMIGPSRSASGGFQFLTVGGAYNISGPPHVTIEGGVTFVPASFSFSPFSYTIQIYPEIRMK